ncbi:MAG: hypothetical protein ABF461_00700 [Zymomonas mobilis subsp. pomaceae]|uniref:hypothetical protein n=1 Tax=Zymomonas mobilis TaxID=542 RepID=UPI0039E987B6
MPEKPPKFLDIQSGHRIKVGLTGLAGVILLVAFAAVLLTLAPKEDNQTSVALNGDIAATVNGRVNLDALEKEPPHDPLAELGVSPGGNIKPPLPDLSSLPTASTQNKIPYSDNEDNTLPDNSQ